MLLVFIMFVSTLCFHVWSQFYALFNCINLNFFQLVFSYLTWKQARRAICFASVSYLFILTIPVRPILSKYTVVYTHRSSLHGDCCSSVECSPVVCSFCAIAAAVPPRPQDGTVSVIVLFTTVSSCVTTVTCNTVRCPCNGLVREVSP